MSRDFIELYDDDGYRYIVNMDKERSLTKPNVMSVKCPACGMSNSIAWGSMDLPPFRQAVAMLADSWNSR